MKKQKSKLKQKQAAKRGLKRSKRFKDSRIKIARKRTLARERFIEERNKFEKMMEEIYKIRGSIKRLDWKEMMKNKF